MNKNILFVSLLFAILCISSVFAITGSIGNARMVLRAKTGDTIEKYVLVKNVNNVSVNIKISVSGDLEKYVKIKDEEFSLLPGEEKKAYFEIDVKKAGTTETKINVQFMQQEGKNGVGLSSTVIVIAEGGGWFESDDNNNNDDKNKNNDNNVSVTTGKAVSNNESDKKISPTVLILLISTGLIAVIFIVLLVIAFKKTKNRGEIKYKKRSGKR